MPNNRLSTYSNASTSLLNGQQSSSQVSTTTLLNALHHAYTSAQPYSLDASTSLTVNTYLNALQTGPDGRDGGTVDPDLAKRAWEHARRRAEDGCVVLASLHPGAPSLLLPFLDALPLTIPSSLYTALAALRPFLHAVSPLNPSTPRYPALAVTLTLNLQGSLTAAAVELSTSGLDTATGLLDVPAEAGHRAFDVFYYLLTAASTPAEREFLGLKDLAAYSLLNRSATYSPPAYLPTADDAAAAEDFRACLKAIGVKGAAQRSLLSVLAGLLKLGDTRGLLLDAEDLEDICEDVGGLLGLDPDVLLRQCSTDDREALITGLYEALVDWVIARANQAVAADLAGADDAGESAATSPAIHTPQTDNDLDTVTITVLDLPGQSLAKAVALRGVFDDSTGINAEMKEDGVDVVPAGASVLREMATAVTEAEADLGLNPTGAASRERDYARDRRETALEKVGREADSDGFLRQLIYPVAGQGVSLGRHGRRDLAATLASSRVWYQLTLHPTDDPPAVLAKQSTTAATAAWSAAVVSRQLRTWRLPEWANRRNKNLDFTADFDIDEFVDRYAGLGCKEGKDGVESWLMERGWSNGEVVLGHERVWMREAAWWEAEGMLDLKTNPAFAAVLPAAAGLVDPPNPNASGFFSGAGDSDRSLHPGRDPLLHRNKSSATLGNQSAMPARSVAASMPAALNPGDYGLGDRGDEKHGGVTYYDSDLGHLAGQMDPELGDAKLVTEHPLTTTRRIWVAVVWALTFWVPSFVLRYIGRMKRPDVRFAWREKVILCLLIALLNGIVVFWIIEFGVLLCPNFDKAWSQKEVSFHQGDNDFWVSFHGQVFDMSKFWRLQHSDMAIQTSSDNMLPFAGANMDPYVVPPLTVSCPGLVSDDGIALQPNNTVQNPLGMHVSGPHFQTDPTTALHDINWYGSKFVPRMQQYLKGDLVWDSGTVASEGQNLAHMWFILNGKVYDLTDYFHTVKVQNDLPAYHFFPAEVEKLVKENPGQDLSDGWSRLANNDNKTHSLDCLDRAFYIGKPDFRNSAKCQVNNYILLAFTIILCTVILAKFLAALQFGSKPRPVPQDKFVICQVPAYTEGEDQLRKALDSLTALQYDNKRKLICVICDGMIVGGGNDRPTPKIVLDILGVDPKIDPPALPFKSVGQSNEQLNYGKVYSGLYEYEGNVVPYVVIVKVGKESEQSKAKPGNRGKRDSQVLLLNFLNRVHHRAPMSPLELEMFHQINNIIGVDPELYEYLLMVDADTSVKEDSLNRLVAACANDAKIAGICGETSLQNEEYSWWTMIQVYEYYISHHLAKAFESLFGSVTCLPGCFSMYRLRTADKGRPLIISDKILREYNIGEVDTLHKKNLLSLGEDRYLTTLMTKHFPYMSYKFVPDAFASTAAPETWSVLISQRRRWINSTIHNLAELVFLPELCGFCCFSMRFVVFIDLFGTIILPATCAYLGYLIYKVATQSGQFPLISIVMIAAVYGLQAVIFILKRQWQHIGWMIIYIIAFPIYAFVLPVYSFWNQDNFSWGSTRIVIGEKGNKQVVALEDDGFDPRSIPLQRWDDYATRNNLPGRRGASAEKPYTGSYEEQNGGYEMDDMHSMYSSVKPASTVLTGFNGGRASYLPPGSPMALGGMGPRQSSNLSLGRYTDQPLHQTPRAMSMAGMSEAAFPEAGVMRNSQIGMDNLISMHSPPSDGRSPTGTGLMMSRRSSTMDFQSRMGQGPSDGMITEAIQTCLREVDLDTVTKKQVRALVEQRLQTQLTGERRTFLDRQIDVELANM